MKNVIITIGREYGSGGKYIGKLVAKKLNINFYDKEIIQKTYEKNGCNYSKLEEYDEVKRNSILKILSSLKINYYDDVFEEEKYQTLIAETIKDLAKTESCVIIGRNANNILKDKSNVLNLFIYSNDIEFKVNRKMESEKLSHSEALSRLKYIDKQRKKYYENLNKGYIWGDKAGYDYCIDSSILGVDKTADLIVEIYNKIKNN